MSTPPGNEKARRDWYLYADDLHIIDTVFGLGQEGLALQGRRMKLTKTQWVRERLHTAVLHELKPIYDRIRSQAQAQAPDQAPEQP